MSVKRTVYLIGLPFGAACALLLLWLERTILFQLFASNALLLLLLYTFGVRVQLYTQQAARLERDANTDVLTALPNRRFLHAQLESEFERAVRYHRTFSVVMLDIDHFKTINDTFGHGVGDGILQEVADAHGEPLTVSLGVAEFAPQETLPALLARADRALYDAQARGRNRVMPEPALY